MSHQRFAHRAAVGAAAMFAVFGLAACGPNGTSSAALDDTSSQYGSSAKLIRDTGTTASLEDSSHDCQVGNDKLTGRVWAMGASACVEK